MSIGIWEVVKRRWRNKHRRNLRKQWVTAIGVFKLSAQIFVAVSVALL